jgi:hypothetical protein
MTLYHGSSVIVKTPKLRHSIRALDFGNGFYTTTNEKQAIQFARKIPLPKLLVRILRNQPISPPSVTPCCQS